MQCPRCGGALRTAEYEGVEVEQCPGCGGYWVPGYRLSRIIEIRERCFSIEEIAAFKELNQAHQGTVHPAADAIQCPECGTPMQQNHYNYAHEVLIDRCPQGHGIWLDPGELEHIQMAVEEHEGDLEQMVVDKGLRMDRTASRQLEQERRKYAFSFWRFFMWRDGF